MTKYGVHAHGCTRCSGRYEDACQTPNEAGVCRPCQGFASWELLRHNRLPRDCCPVHSRLMNKDEVKQYRLSTACSWFRCTACSRTFPFRHPQRSTA